MAPGERAASFPSVSAEYHSETADVHNTNNISGFKDKRIDEI